MALRRPRVKACANLSSKRKVKKETDDVAAGDSEIKIKEEIDQKIGKPSEKTPAVSLENKNCKNIPSLEKQDKVLTDNTISLNKHHSKISSPPRTSEKIKESQNEVVQTCSDQSSSIVQTENQFKCPPRVERKEDKITQPYIFDSEQNIEMQHNAATNSPVKPRQRIRPMPYFALRRNSMQGSGPDSEDESKRHKLSAITAHSPLTVDSKMNSFNFNRKRTESTCSNVSESYIPRENRPRKIFVTEESQRISAAKKEFQNKFSGKPPEKSLLKMFDFIYYNPSTNPMKQAQKSANEEGKTDEKQTSAEVETVTDENLNNKQVTENQDKPEEVTNMPVPQLKLGPNGELVLDETSLVIETTAEKEARAKLANSSVIYVDENTGNNGFYRRKKRTKDWSAEETIKFYRCLHTVGTDFSLMLTLFPKRSRRDLKLKFKKEEKHNLALINKALLYPKTFDIEELKGELERDEREAAEKQKQWDEILNKTVKAKESTKIKKAPKLSKVDRCLSNADKVYANENIVLRRSGRPKKSAAKSQNNDEENNVENEKDENNDDYEINEQTIVDALFESDEEVDKHCNITKVKENKSDTQDNSNCKNKPEIEEKFFANVNNVLREIANGSLVVVSSEDPNDPDEIIHEIYVICKETGDLSDEPLELPDDVMQCIISAIHA